MQKRTPPETRPSRLWESFVFELHDEPLATLLEMPRKELRRARGQPQASNPIAQLRQLHDRFVSSKLFYVEDHSNQQVARITYLSGSGVGYVLELEPGIQHRFPTIALAACIIADNAFVEPPSGGGG